MGSAATVTTTLQRQFADSPEVHTSKIANFELSESIYGNTIGENQLSQPIISNPSVGLVSSSSLPNTTCSLFGFLSPPQPIIFVKSKLNPLIPEFHPRTGQQYQGTIMQTQLEYMQAHPAAPLETQSSTQGMQPSIQMQGTQPVQSIPTPPIMIVPNPAYTFQIGLAPADSVSNPIQYVDMNQPMQSLQSLQPGAQYVCVDGNVQYVTQSGCVYRQAKCVQAFSWVWLKSVSCLPHSSRQLQTKSVPVQLLSCRCIRLLLKLLQFPLVQKQSECKHISPILTTFCLFICNTFPVRTRLMLGPLSRPSYPHL